MGVEIELVTGEMRLVGAAFAIEGIALLVRLWNLRLVFFLV